MQKRPTYVDPAITKARELIASKQAREAIKVYEARIMALVQANDAMEREIASLRAQPAWSDGPYINEPRTHRSQDQIHEPSSDRPWWIIPVVVVVMIFALFLLALWVDNYLNNRPSDTEKWWNKARPSVQAFLDAEDIASTTPRMSVSTIILEMQRHQREFRDVKVPSGAQEVYEAIDKAMTFTLTDYQYFSSGGDPSMTATDTAWSEARFEVRSAGLEEFQR